MFSLNSVNLIGHIEDTPSYSEETTTSQSRIWFKLKITPEQPGHAPHSVGMIGWNKIANHIAENCGKGCHLLIKGKLESRIIHTTEGFTTDVVYIVIEQVSFESALKKNVPTQDYFDNKPAYNSVSLQVEEQEEDEYPDFQDPDATGQPKENMLSALKKLGIGEDEILDLIKKDMTERRKTAF